MPLYHHFHEPIVSRRHYTSVHSTWATYLAEDLNSALPPGYVAEPNLRFAIEIDVATWEERGGPPRAVVPPQATWEPPAPQLTIPLTIVTDVVEVQIFRNEGGAVLAGAVEFVSPANKDRPASRDAFVSKCASYLQQGSGLVIIDDVVTALHANLHRELLSRVSPGSAAAEADLYAASYRPVQRNGDATLDVWHESLAVGQSLPTMPLWLRGGLCLPLRLEKAYDRTVRMLRFPDNGG